MLLNFPKCVNKENSLVRFDWINEYVFWRKKTAMILFCFRFEMWIYIMQCMNESYFNTEVQCMSLEWWRKWICLYLIELNLSTTDQKDHKPGWSAVERIETSITNSNIYSVVGIACRFNRFEQQHFTALASSERWAALWCPNNGHDTTTFFIFAIKCVPQ